MAPICAGTNNLPSKGVSCHPARFPHVQSTAGSVMYDLREPRRPSQCDLVLTRVTSYGVDWPRTSPCHGVLGMGVFVTTRAISGPVALDPTPHWPDDSVGFNPPGHVRFYSLRPVVLSVRLSHIRANHRINGDDNLSRLLPNSNLETSIERGSSNCGRQMHQTFQNGVSRNAPRAAVAMHASGVIFV